MRVLKAIGGSIAALYFVCALLAVYSIGGSSPAVAESSNADRPVKVHEVKAPAVEQEGSVVAEAADAVPDWMVILTSLISLAGVITAATPTPRDNVVLGVLRKVLDVFALNFGGARNASADKSKSRSG
jgi:hypothetical protein